MTKKPEDARQTLADINTATEQARAAIRRSQDLTWTDPEFQRWEHGQIRCPDEPHPIDRIVFGEDGLVFHQAEPGPLHQRREASNHRRLMFQLCEDGAGSAGGGERFRAEDYPAPEDITWSGPLMLGPDPADLELDWETDAEWDARDEATLDARMRQREQREVNNGPVTVDRDDVSYTIAGRLVCDYETLHLSAITITVARNGSPREWQGRFSVAHAFVVNSLSRAVFEGSRFTLNFDGRDYPVRITGWESEIEEVRTPYDIGIPDPTRIRPRRSGWWVEFVGESEPPIPHQAGASPSGVWVDEATRDGAGQPEGVITPSVAYLQRRIRDAGYSQPREVHVPAPNEPGPHWLREPDPLEEPPEPARIVMGLGELYVGPINGQAVGRLEEAMVAFGSAYVEMSRRAVRILGGALGAPEPDREAMSMTPRAYALHVRTREPAWAVFTHQPQSSPRGNQRQHQPSRRPRQPARAPRRTGRQA